MKVSDRRIEKNIPIPNHPHRTIGPLPFKELQIGDSFLVKGIRSAAEISSRMVHARLHTGFRFKTSATKEGVRVWRVS